MSQRRRLALASPLVGSVALAVAAPADAAGPALIPGRPGGVMIYTSKSARNYTGYCDEEAEKLIEWQSQELDVKKRLALVQRIHKKLRTTRRGPCCHGATTTTPTGPT
jgi:ABC-type transport system substrate-binding protein